MSLLLNFVMYELGWFAIVLGAAAGHPWWGAVLALMLVTAHLVLTRGWPRHFGLIVAAGVIGLAIDSLQLRIGILRYPSDMIYQWVAPFWDVVLWMQFATLLPFCLRWLSGRYVLGAVLGFVGGPFAFYSGEKLGAVEFLPPRSIHFAILGIAWGVAFPLLVWLSDRLVLDDGLGVNYRFVAWPNHLSGSDGSGG